MSVLRSVLTYMGLGPDEAYDDGYLYEADRRRDGRAPADDQQAQPAEIDLRDHSEAHPDLVQDDGVDPHAQRTRPEWMGGPVAEDGSNGEPGETTFSDPSPGDSTDGPTTPEPHRTGGPRVETEAERSSGKHLRPLRAVPASVPAEPTPHGDEVEMRDAGPRLATPLVLMPRSFGDAKLIADDFKAERPVVMDLREVDRALARRLIDFASGICYALDGGMEKLATQVFLLTPSDVDVSEADRGRLATRDYRG